MERYGGGEELGALHTEEVFLVDAFYLAGMGNPAASFLVSACVLLHLFKL